MKWLTLFTLSTLYGYMGKLDVTLPDGSQVRGSIKFASAVTNRPIYSYRGIPYAKPPVGDLRFRPPQPLDEPWDGVLDATTERVCSQLDYLTMAYIGEEDCLHLNVHVPHRYEKDDPTLLPVMVFIHGGWFYSGDGGSKMYGPDRLLDRDVILVTINYRLGPMGFLTTMDNNLPANNALLDQQMALKWIKKNIAAFGGDSSRITIFGESAGSASVMYQFLSPGSEGLFNAVIAQSGSAISGFASSLDRHPAYYARSMAAKLGCDPEARTGQLRDCLLTKDVKDIVENSLIDNNIFEYLPMRWIPVVDGKFIPDDPLKLLESGKFNKDIPVMTGFNADEGLIITWKLLKLQSEMDKFNGDLEANMLSLITGRGSNIEASDAEKKLVREIIEKNFGGDVPIVQGREGSFKKLEEIAADVHFNAIGVKTARLLAKHSNSPVYEYLYEHQGSTSLMDFTLMPRLKVLGKIVGRLFGQDWFYEPVGVAHCDELMLLFEWHLLPFDSVFSESDKTVSAQLVNLWTNFAATNGKNPTKDDGGALGINWERLDLDDSKRLIIGSDGARLEKVGKEEEARMEWWEKVWEKIPPGGSFLRNEPKWEESKNMYSGKVGSRERKEEL